MWLASIYKCNNAKLKHKEGFTSHNNSNTKACAFYMEGLLEGTYLAQDPSFSWHPSYEIQLEDEHNRFHPALVILRKVSHFKYPPIGTMFYGKLSCI